MSLIAGFEVRERLFESRRSVIYRASRSSDGRPVVLKVLRSEYPSTEEIARLRREYRITKSVHAKGVIEVLGLPRVGDGLAIVMEDIGGDSLARRPDAGPMDQKAFLRLAIQLADALGEVHQRRVMHKDVNPSNIILDARSGQARLIDFGIATELPRESPAVTNPSVLEGTLAYMSPEQTGRMNRATDYRTDFYSLGVTFYELLTGELPFASSDALDLVHCHIAKMPRPPHEVVKGLSPVISAIVLKLMAKRAEDRYQSGFALEADLERCLASLEAKGSIEAFSIGTDDGSHLFQIPQELYGRERETDLLIGAFERASAGAAEVMLVSGYSGIGKSALVHEVHKPIVRRHGFFVSGKFDQFQRNIPYASLLQAIRGFVRQLLLEPPDALERWRERIVGALRPNAKVLIDVVHELELVTGAQPPVAELPPREAENRLNVVFERFFRVVADERHPLAMFLDDLQWADIASLKLLERLMTDPATRHMLLIGAYRDNEVDGQHPLLVTLANMRKAGARIGEVTLGPLAAEHCTALVAGALRSDPAAVQPLSDLCLRRSGGNPFFLTQYLLSLQGRGLIERDARSGRWRFDMDRIEAAPMTDDVVALMAGKISLLDEGAQRVLRLAACIGNTFDLATLALVSEAAAEATAAALWPALQEGLVLPLGDSYKLVEDGPVSTPGLEGAAGAEKVARKVAYRFLHDRVQQAAHSLIPEADRPAYHLKVGRLLRDAAPGEGGADVFEIVNQLDAGADLITDELERAALAELNAEAAKRAKESAAYGAALAYLETGIRLLDDGWTRRRDLSLDLHLAAAEASYLNGEVERTDRYLDEALLHAEGTLEKVRAYEIRIQARMTQARMTDALDAARDILAHLEITFPDEPGPADVMGALEEVTKAIGDRSIASLAELPEVLDPRRLAALRILNKTTSSSYLAKPSLFPVIVLRQVLLSIQYGATGACAFGYTLYGLLRIAILGDIDGGYAFGQVASRVIERFDAKDYETRTRACVACFLSHWKEPLRAVIDDFVDNYRSGFDTGDLEYTAWSGKYATVIAYLHGDELPEVREAALRYIETLSPYKQDAIVQYIRTALGVVEALSGDSDEPWRLTGAGHDFDAIAEAYRAGGDRSGLCWAYVHKLIACVLFHRTEEAQQALSIVEAHADSMVGTIYVPYFNIYSSLARLALCAGAAEETKRDLLARVDESQKSLKLWAEHAPANRAHAFALVEAERARVLGEPERARGLYYRALALAREHGHRREEALATELFARFLFAAGEDEAGQLFLVKARHLYRHWGARAKVRHLEVSHPAALSRAEVAAPAEHRIDVTSTTKRESAEVLDFSSVIQASQAISGEVVLPDLLRRIMVVVIQNAGARRGFLYLPGASPLVVDVDATAETEPVVTLGATTLEAHDEASQTIVRYVLRTHEQIVLGDATREGPFQSHFGALRDRARSILCFPVLHHSELVGVLYLENDLVAGAFTPDRCRVLGLLAAQAAISLENARVYETLENRVQERTRALSEALEHLRRTQRQLVAQEKLASLGMLTSGIAHELKNPLNFVINFARMSASLTSELDEELGRLSPVLGDQGAPLAEISGVLRQHATKITEHGRRADEIVRSMLEHGKASLSTRQDVDVNRLLEESVRVACEAFRIEHADFSADVELDLDAGIAQISASPQDLAQVMRNLVHNACHAAWEHHRARGSDAPRPRVRASTGERGEHVEIRIRDNGAGIPAELRDKIFQPFFTTKPAGEGTGLGLSLSHDIVAGHHGTLEVAPDSGEGAELVVRLPRRGGSAGGPRVGREA